MGAAVIITVLLGMMGIVFTGVSTFKLLNDDSVKKAFENALDGLIGLAKNDASTYPHTAAFLNEYESKGLTAKDLRKFIVTSVLAVNGTILQIGVKVWNVIRELAKAIARGAVKMSVSAGATAGSAKIIAEAGKYTNFADNYADKKFDSALLELAATIVSGGAAVSAVRSEILSGATHYNRDYTCYYICYRGKKDSSGNWETADYESSVGITVSGYVIPADGYNPLTIKKYQRTTSSYTSYIKAYDAEGNDITDEVAILQVLPYGVSSVTTALTRQFLLATGSQNSTSAATHAINSGDKTIGWYIFNYVSDYIDKDFTVSNTIVNSEVVVGSDIDAGVLSDVYGKLTDTAGTGALGDVITPGRVIDDSGVITGPVAVDIPDTWATTYPDLASLLASLAEILARIGVYPVVLPDDRVIVPTDDPAKDDTATDTTAQDKIDEIDNDPNPPVPPIIPPPTIGITSSGFITLFNPTMSELSALNDVLWSEDFITNFRKMISDPIDGIISLLAVPISPSTGGKKNVRFGNYDSGISMRKVNNQFGSYSCGSMKISEKFKNYLDYAPYTRVILYLPFIGFITLNTNEVMNSTIAVNYNIDFLTGDCIAQVSINKTGLKAVGYVFNGNMGMQLPVTGANYSRLYSSVAKGVGAIGAGIVSGGAATIALAASGAALNTAMSAGGDIQKSGSISGNSGFLGEFTPYIIVTKPVPNMSSGFNAIEGYIANARVNLGNIKGYARVKDIHLSIANATAAEINEIENLLKTGVEF